MASLQALFVLAQLVLGLMLAYSCFCRLTKTDADTVREIRWAICLEGIAGGMVAGAPFLPSFLPEFRGDGHFAWQPGQTPAWVYLLLLLAATLVQLSTARFWRYNVPEDFQRRGFL